MKPFKLIIGELYVVTNPHAALFLHSPIPDDYQVWVQADINSNGQLCIYTALLPCSANLWKKLWDLYRDDQQTHWVKKSCDITTEIIYPDDWHELSRIFVIVDSAADTKIQHKEQKLKRTTQIIGFMENIQVELEQVKTGIKEIEKKSMQIFDNFQSLQEKIDWFKF